MKLLKKMLILLLALTLSGGTALAEGATLTLPAALKVIGEEAFMNDTGFSTVVLPEGVLEIGPRAFAGSGLTQIYLPASLESIADDALDGPDHVTVTAEPGTYAWRWAVRLGYIAVSELPESEHPYAAYSTEQWTYSHPEAAAALRVTFDEQTDLEMDTLTLTDAAGNVRVFTGTELAGQTIVTSGSFFELVLATDATGQEYGFRVVSVEAMSDVEYANYKITDAFVTRELSDGTLEIIGYEGGVNSVSIPVEINGKTVTSIAANAFAHSPRLDTVSMPVSLTHIDNAAFAANPALTTVLAPEGTYAYDWAVAMGYIGAEPILESEHPYAANADVSWHYQHPSQAAALRVTFSPRTDLEADELTVTDAFGNAQAFTETELAGASLVLAGDHFDLRLVSDATGEVYGFAITAIEALTDTEYGEYIAAHEFVTRTLSDGTLEITGWNGSGEEIIIPASIDGTAVTAIGANAFSGASVTSVEIPGSVTRIADSAFSGCPNLATVQAEEGTYGWYWGIRMDYIQVEAILESPHPYPNNYSNTWQYTYPGTAAALKVTFSPKTDLELDTLTITDASGVPKVYHDDELAGKTIVLEGKTFTVQLDTDDQETRYGFAITKIEAMSASDYQAWRNIRT